MIRESSLHSLHSWKGALSLVESALVARDQGDLDQARRILDNMTQQRGGPANADLAWWIRYAVHTAQASVALRADNPRHALDYLRPVLAEPEELTHAWVLETVDLVAIALAQQGRAEQAALLLGAVDQERERVGLVVAPPDAPIREAAMLDAQAILGKGWDTAVQLGRATSLDEATDLATNAATGRPGPRDAAEKTSNEVIASS